MKEHAAGHPQPQRDDPLSPAHDYPFRPVLVGGGALCLEIYLGVHCGSALRRKMEAPGDGMGRQVSPRVLRGALMRGIARALIPCRGGTPQTPYRPLPGNCCCRVGTLAELVLACVAGPSSRAPPLGGGWGCAPHGTRRRGCSSASARKREGFSLRGGTLASQEGPPLIHSPKHLQSPSGTFGMSLGGQAHHPGRNNSARGQP